MIQIKIVRKITLEHDKVKYNTYSEYFIYLKKLLNITPN